MYCFCRFEELAQGSYPLGIKKVELPEGGNFAKQVHKSVNDLNAFENELYLDSAKNRKNKRKRPEGESENLQQQKTKVSKREQSKAINDVSGML